LKKNFLAGKVLTQLGFNYHRQSIWGPLIIVAVGKDGEERSLTKKEKEDISAVADLILFA
jgi:hypothetical protein